MKSSSSIYPVPFSDFKRICSVIYAILKSEDADPRISYVFVNIAGAAILNTHYKIKAKVCAGAAIYKLTTNGTLELRDKDNKFVVGTPDGFHCWIDTGEWFIDFTSFMYPEMLKLAGSNDNCDKKMFQKSYEQMSKSPDDVQKIGDFFVYPNSELTKEIINCFFSLPANKDLLKIICHWYKKPPKKILNSIKVGGKNNQNQDISFLNINLVGCW